MKVLVKSKAEVGIWLEDKPMPQCGPQDVLVKVNKTANDAANEKIFFISYLPILDKILSNICKNV